MKTEITIKAKIERDAEGIQALKELPTEEVAQAVIEEGSDLTASFQEIPE